MAYENKIFDHQQCDYDPCDYHIHKHDFDEYDRCYMCNYVKSTSTDRCVACGVSVCFGECGLPVNN